MAKPGRVPTGGAAAGGATQGRGGGPRMLPPTPGAPIEYTPAYAAGQNGQDLPASPLPPQQGNPGGPSAPQTAPQPAKLGSGLPDPDAKPEEQLAACERAIHDAKARAVAAINKATNEFIDEAGPYLCWVHEHKLYKLMKGNSGKPYRSFEKYAHERHDIGRTSAYRVTREIPLLRLLEVSAHPVASLSARQIEVLHPTRLQHGETAVKETWETAWATKKKDVPTPAELAQAKELLGFQTKPDTDETPTLEKKPASVTAEVQRVQKILVPETLRQAVKENPDEVVRLARTVNAALAEAGIPLD